MDASIVDIENLENRICENFDSNRAKEIENRERETNWDTFTCTLCALHDDTNCKFTYKLGV